MSNIIAKIICDQIANLNALTHATPELLLKLDFLKSVCRHYNDV